MTEECVFCRIVAGEAEASIAYEDASTLAFMDINQFSPGHALVLPKQHVQDIYEIDAETGTAVMLTVSKVAAAVRQAFQPQGINVWQSNGAPFQDVFHLHFHILPRWTDDGLLHFRPPRARPSRAELDQQAGKIRVFVQEQT